MVIPETLAGYSATLSPEPPRRLTPILTAAVARSS